MKTLLLISASFMIALQTNTNSSERNAEMIQSDSIKIMSYNIRYDNPDDGINAWSNRSDQVAEMMGKKYQADIIGVQEALKSQIDELQNRLPSYSWVGVGRDDGKEAGEFSPIFYKSDRFELVATNTFWLSESPDQPGSISWDAAITRVATWAILKEKSSGEDFYVINTHFDHMGEVARVESAKVIGEFVSNIDEEFPVVITGDFNVPETSEAYSVMTNLPGISDARYASETEHEGPTATFNNWEELGSDESRIDYIFVRDNVRALTHKILDDRYDGRFPSDHLPVLSEVLLPE
ncbi:MAG: endonuclease/exonuclease/phosphatase family protein [Balneolaceae bacterium]